MQIKRI